MPWALGSVLTRACLMESSSTRGVIISDLQMTKLRLREATQLPKNTQQISDRARVQARVYLTLNTGL